jgi:hypothetical protein
MTQEWLRLHRRTVNNPKLQKLGLEVVGFWTNCLCLSDDEGYLPDVADVAWAMRVSETAAETFLVTLQRNNLIVRDDDGRLRLHDWDDHQKRSDSSTDRVRKFRQKRQKLNETHDETPCNVSETVQSRADTEKKDTSLRSVTREGNAPALRVVEKPKPSSKTPAGSSWPPDAVIPSPWVRDAEAARSRAGKAAVDLEAEAERFANHFAANGKRMKDWRRAWLNWATSPYVDQLKGSGNGSRTGAKSQLEQLADIVRSGQVING